MKHIVFTAFLLCMTGLSFQVHAQRSDSIAAVVNNDVITYTDVYDRIDMVVKSSGMPNKREFKEKLLPQVLTALITESIQLQEAKKLGLKTTSEEIEEGFGKIAEQNGMKPEQFSAILKRQNVRPSTLQRQIESQLAWGKVIQSEIRPRVVLNDTDVEMEVDRLKSKEGQTEYSIAEIVLPVDANNPEEKTLDVAKDLKKQLSKDIQNFPAAARQFSQSASAASGGILGWVTLDQLSPELADIVQNLEPRTLSEPIRTDDGYILLFVRESRVIDLGGAGQDAEKLRVKYITFNLDDNEATRKTQIATAENFARDVTGCLDITKRATKIDNAYLQEIFDTPDHIPAAIRDAVEGRNIGDATAPIENGDQIMIAMLCGREGGNADGHLAREIENRIGMQRMDILQKRYLRDLIADAYIERRI